MTDTRARLVKATAHAERLLGRARQHHRALREHADALADHATASASELEAAALRGEPAALHARHRALMGRAILRRVAGRGPADADDDAV
jgi:hypothetical protein